MLFIGNEVKKRMGILNLSSESLACKAFLELEDVESIIDDRIPLQEIDEYDLQLMCSVLHCRPEYFFDESVREKDLLTASMNRGIDNEKSIDVKVKIQNYLNDFYFISELLSEIP